MSWLGKILGGGIGFVIGGPIGAVLGAAIGHSTIDAGGTGFTGLEQKQGIYFTAVFSMLGKLSKADGMVTQHEIDAIERVMRDNLRLSAEAREFAIRIFNAAKDSSQPFEEFAIQLRDEFGNAPEVLVSIIDLLMMVAYSDGHLHRTEEALILSAVRIFGLEQEYRQIKGRFGGDEDDLGRCYEILGSEEGDDLATIKRRYRKLAMEYHPDRIQAKGMAPEFAEAAEEKFKEIQHAYDVLEKELGR